MSDLEQRLERLAEKLTAKERGLVVLRAFKEERRQTRSGAGRCPRSRWRSSGATSAGSAG